MTFAEVKQHKKPPQQYSKYNPPGHQQMPSFQNFHVQSIKSWLHLGQKPQEMDEPGRPTQSSQSRGKSNLGKIQPEGVWKLVPRVN